MPHIPQSFLLYYKRLEVSLFQALYILKVPLIDLHDLYILFAVVDKCLIFLQFYQQATSLQDPILFLVKFYQKISLVFHSIFVKLLGSRLFSIQNTLPDYLSSQAFQICYPSTLSPFDSWK